MYVFIRLPGGAALDAAGRRVLRCSGDWLRQNGGGAMRPRGAARGAHQRRGGTAAARNRQPADRPLSVGRGRRL